MESGPESGGTKFGIVLGKTSILEAIPVPSQPLGEEGHERPAKGRDEALSPTLSDVRGREGLGFLPLPLSLPAGPPSLQA